MMKPEKFIGIMLLTLLLSCEMEEQQPACPADRVDQKLGTICFETNQYIMNSSFEIDIYIDGKKAELQHSSNSTIVSKKIEVGVHHYEIKIYSYNGEPSKTVKGRFIINANKTYEVFIDFKNYNSWT